MVSGFNIFIIQIFITLLLRFHNSFMQTCMLAVFDFQNLTLNVLMNLVFLYQLVLSSFVYLQHVVFKLELCSDWCLRFETSTSETFTFQTTIYKDFSFRCLNFWTKMILSESNRIRSYDFLVCKPTLRNLVKLTKWFEQGVPWFKWVEQVIPSCLFWLRSSFTYRQLKNLDSLWNACVTW